MFGEKMLRLVVGVLVGAQVARYLGVENFGTISYAISLTAIFTAVSTLGLDEIVINMLVKKEYDKDVIMGTSLALRMVASLLVIAIIGSYTLFITTDSITSIYILIISFGIVFQAFNVIDMYFQSRVQSKYMVFANIVSLLVISSLRLYFIYIKAPLLYFVWAVFLDNLLLALWLLYFYYKKKEKVISWKFRFEVAVKMLKASSPIALAGILVAIYMRVDQIIIKQQLDLASVGNYSAAARVSELWYFIPMALAGSVFPALINAKKTNELLYMKRLQQLFDIMVALAITIAIGVMLFSKLIIGILYGPQFTQAAYILTIHIWAGVFVFIGVANSKFTVIEGLTVNALYRTMIGVVLSILLNLALIPRFGIVGSAYSILISQFVSSYLSNLFWKKNRPVFMVISRSLNIIGLIKRLRFMIQHRNLG